ncbi:MAG: hypothetical protein HYZ29_10685 [Myxococcales bacterium]|nr:hypothetical protein [Myxococcales bacterium]
MSWLRLAAFLAALSVAASAHADRVGLDRAVVRFSAPETGGVRTPRFIFERTLAFEARVEALADPDRAQARDGRPYRERHVRAALERHVAETLLSSLRIDPEPTERELARQTDAARRMFYARAGGALAVEQAASAEGIDSRELTSILRRQARSSLYLDRMVAPMLTPSEAELRNIHRSAQTPFRDHEFDEIEPALRRWYVGKRLSSALAAFFQNARSRVSIAVLSPP